MHLKSCFFCLFCFVLFLFVLFLDEVGDPCYEKTIMQKKVESESKFLTSVESNLWPIQHINIFVLPTGKFSVVQVILIRPSRQWSTNLASGKRHQVKVPTTNVSGKFRSDVCNRYLVLQIYWLPLVCLGYWFFSQNLMKFIYAQILSQNLFLANSWCRRWMPSGWGTNAKHP